MVIFALTFCCAERQVCNVLRHSLIIVPLLLGACASDVPTTAPDAPSAETLRAADIPAGFDFKTTQSYRLRIEAGLATLPSGADALVVRRLDGTVVFRGALRADVPLELNLSLPAADREVDVVVGSGETLRSVRVGVDRHAVSLDS